MNQQQSDYSERSKNIFDEIAISNIEKIYVRGLKMKIMKKPFKNQ